MARPALTDTSVAVALLVADHPGHAATLRAISQRRLGLAGHAAFETFSVLTRLPAPARRSPEVVGQLLAENFPETRFLTPDRAGALLEDLRRTGLSGGSVYDALVGATAAEHQLRLFTRDRRALETYRVLAVEVELID